MDPEEAAARARKRPAPWTAEHWRSAGKLPERYAAICLEPETFFETADDVKTFLGLDYMPETCETIFSRKYWPDKTKLDQLPLIKYCDIKRKDFEKLREVVKVEDWGMVLIDGNMVYSYGVSLPQRKGQNGMDD